MSGLPDKDFSSTRPVRVVLTGFALSFVTKGIVGLFVQPVAARALASIPPLTLSLLLAVTVSPLITMTYLKARTGYFPKVTGKKDGFVLFSGAGCVAVWGVMLLQGFLLDKHSPFVHDIMNAPPFYYYSNLGLFILGGPFVEELLYRGFFLEILRRKQTTSWAVVITSFLFTLGHLWGGLDIGLLFVFLGSVIFSFVYIRNGLVASMVVHAFDNALFFFFYS
jgi:membrane protease YdiL (CAAX protease family)